MKKLVWVGVAVIGVAIFWSRSDSDSKLVFDRFWVDHMPRDQDDHFHAFMMSGEHPFGHFAVQTEWRGQWEGFHYHVVPRTDEIDLLFPASNQRERVQFRARPCHEQGFDYCLEVKGSSRGATRYYSKRAWDREETAMRDLRK